MPNEQTVFHFVADKSDLLCTEDLRFSCRSMNQQRNGLDEKLFSPGKQLRQSDEAQNRIYSFHSSKIPRTPGTSNYEGQYKAFISQTSLSQYPGSYRHGIVDGTLQLKQEPVFEDSSKFPQSAKSNVAPVHELQVLSKHESVECTSPKIVVNTQCYPVTDISASQSQMLSVLSAPSAEKVTYRAASLSSSDRSPISGFDKDPSSGIYVCRHCNYSTTHKGDMNKHQRKITGERPYKCSECNKGFIQSINLKLHLRTHTGEKPYLCEICGRQFTQKIHFLKHRCKAAKSKIAPYRGL